MASPRKSSNASGRDDESVVSKDARRQFLAVFTAVMTGGLAILGPLAAGISFVLSPLLRRPTTTEGDGFVKIAMKASQLLLDGPPQLVGITCDKCDAWNHEADRPVGNIWIRRTAEDKIIAFSATCPHLGCSVEHRVSESDFFCPCHNSTFGLDGERRNRIPPRGLDALEVRVEEDVIFVKFEQFRGGIPEKLPV